MVIKICLVCKKEFKVKPYLVNTAKNCSYDCYWKSMRGIKPHNKGKKASQETIEKLRIAHLGQKVSSETRQKMSEYNKRIGWKPPVNNGMLGKKHTAETKRKISKANAGKSHPQSLEYRLLMSERMKGARSKWWKGGITPLRAKIYNSFEYKNWRKQVYERDNFTCQFCGVRGVEINADHIKPFSKFPDLRFDINNGRTLCVPCHRKTDTYGTRANNYCK